MEFEKCKNWVVNKNSQLTSRFGDPNVKKKFICIYFPKKFAQHKYYCPNFSTLTALGIPLLQLISAQKSRRQYILNLKMLCLIL